jgi:hypothetical protein
MPRRVVLDGPLRQRREVYTVKPPIVRGSSGELWGERWDEPEAWSGQRRPGDWIAVGLLVCCGLGLAGLALGLLLAALEALL